MLFSRTPFTAKKFRFPLCRIVSTALILYFGSLVSGLVPGGETDSVVYAQRGTVPQTHKKEELVREIYVPFDDLNIVLEKNARRVFLSRQEYGDLLSKAQQAPETKAPQPFSLLRANYQAVLEEDRARITGELEIDLLQDGLQAIPLQFDNVGIRSAILDGKPAALGPLINSRARLFVEGRGKHKLLLEVVTPLVTDAAQQSIRFLLPTAPASQVKLTVPGNVEIKRGAHQIRRVTDEQAGLTKFDLVLENRETNKQTQAPAGSEIVMSLNNRLRRKQRVVVARNVIVDELTSAFERLHVTNEMEILHGSADSFKYALPDGFEVTDVNTPQLSRWEIEKQEGKSFLVVTLREAQTEPVIVNFSLVGDPGEIEQWTMPQVRATEVAGEMSVVGLLIEDRLRLVSLAPEGVIPLDIADLTARLPASVYLAEPGAPQLRPAAVYYAPQGDYRLRAEIEKPPANVNIRADYALRLEDQQQTLQGGFALRPQVEKLFDFSFSLSGRWHVDAIHNAAGAALKFERFVTPQGRQRIRIRFSQGIKPGSEYVLRFSARSTPKDWLGQWEQKQVAFPNLKVLTSGNVVGAVLVRAADDLIVRPDEAEKLTTLDPQQRMIYGISVESGILAYRFDSEDFVLKVTALRTAPRLTARSYAIYGVFPGHVACRYQLDTTITDARSDRIRFTLPKETPGELRITGTSGTVVKDYFLAASAQEKTWNVLLASKRTGLVRLKIEFDLPIDLENKQTIDLPMLVADKVAYQSGVLGVEGNAELDVAIEKTDLRRVDPGELVDADFRVGRRLIGAFGFASKTPSLSLKIARNDSYAIPDAIVQKARIVTRVASDGLSQTAATFELRTKAQFLEVKLPPHSILWSTYLDNQPSKPQQEGDRLLLSLPPRTATSTRALRIVYEAPIENFSVWGKLNLAAPELSARTQDGAQASSLPVADLAWHLLLPSGYQIVNNEGTVFNQKLNQKDAPLANISRFIYRVAGGFGESGVFISTRESGQTLPSPYYMSDDVQYNAPDAEIVMQSEAEAMRRNDLQNDLYDQSASMNRELYAGGEEAGKPDSAEIPFPGTAESSPAVPTGEPRSQAAGNQPQDRPQPADPFADPRRLNPSGTPPSNGNTKEIAAQTENPVEEIYSAGAIGGGAAGGPPGYPRKHTKIPGWALEGLASLNITIDEEQGGEQILFSSLGAEPRLEVTVVDRRRLESLAWSVFGVVILIGLLLSRRKLSQQISFVALVALIAVLVPLVTGWSEQLGQTFACAFYAAFYLLIYYVVLQVLCIFCRWIAPHIPWRISTATAALLLATCYLPLTAGAQPVVVQVEKPAPPVDVPSDAVIIPYDPEKGIEAAKSEKIMIPYDKYSELWNLAYPERSLQASKPPAKYALSGASFQTELSGDETLTVRGHVNIDLFVEESVIVLLPFSDGMFARSELDGKPAQLRIVDAARQQTNAPPNQAPNASGSMRPPFRNSAKQSGVNRLPRVQMLMLFAKGKGRKRLDLEIRYRLQRQGGWRIVQGRLPAASATELAIRVPQRFTEIRLGNLLDRTRYETAKDNQQIRTALSGTGEFQIQWRPKIAEAMVDRSLTAQSSALVDLREDGLRIRSKFKLLFERSSRDFFVLQLPKGFLVERVLGENIRSWQLTEAEGSNRLEVTLLKAVKNQESFDVLMSQRDAIQSDKLAKIDVPTVAVEGAVLHQGEILLRRSPMLEVRIVETENLKRSDFPAVAENKADPSLLGIVPYQAYQFSTTPYKLQLEVSPIASQAQVTVQSLLKIAERQRSLESRILVHPKGRPVHVVRVQIPRDLRIGQVVAPGGHQWAVDEKEESRVLAVYLATGESSPFSLVVTGTLGKHELVEQVALPQVHVQEMASEQGYLVVQVDPGYDAKIANLKNCETVLLQRVAGWLQQKQRDLARLVLHYRQADYSGTVQLVPRKPQVTCFTISNVRVTDRAIEETVSLEYRVRNAGTSRLQFQLPAWLKDARITVPMLRQKRVQPIAGRDRVRVTIDLQEEVMGQVIVLVELSRKLAAEAEAPIPVVENARVTQRYVVLESAGLGELVVPRKAGFQLLDRQQKEWRMLADVLGEKITQAYLIQEASETPVLKYSMKDRTRIETIGASIGLSQLEFILDPNGAYRAAQTYHVDNATEQFLELQLPADAQLWTASVAGEPVKPSKIPGTQTAGRVRIPIIKTAEGDTDFKVTLKYGGKLSRLGRVDQVQFPMIHTVNIRVQLAQVRLRLPETHRWFDFGGTMRLVENEKDFEETFLSYCVNNLQQLSLTIQSSKNPYAIIRGKANLKFQKDAIHELKSRSEISSSDESDYERFSAIEKEQEKVEQQLEALTQDETGSQTTLDNKSQLSRRYSGQSLSRSKNAVNDLGFNWQTTSPQANQPTEPQSPAQGKLKGGYFRNAVPQKRPQGKSEGKPQSRILDVDKLNASAAQQQGQQALIVQEERALLERSQMQQSQPRSSSGERIPASGRGAHRERNFAKQQQLQKYELQFNEQIERQKRDEARAEGSIEGDELLVDGSNDRRAQRDLPTAPGMEYAAAPGAGMAAYEATGLASLDVDLPQRGTEFFLTMTSPDDQIMISARAVSNPLVVQLRRLAWVLGLLLVLLLVWRSIQKHGWDSTFHWRRSAVLILLGLVSLALSIFPTAGLLLLLIGIVQVVRLSIASRSAAQPAG